MDLLGYLVLLRIAERLLPPEPMPAPPVFK